DGNIQAVGIGGDFSRPAVGAEVLEDLHRIARLWSLGGVGILDRFRDPEPAPGVKGNVERLMDVRLGGNELDLEPWRKMKGLALVGRRLGLRRRDIRIDGFLSEHTFRRYRDEKEREAHCEQRHGFPNKARSI